MHQVVREGESVSSVVVECVAAVTGRDPMELSPFAESIDTDAIEAFFDRSGGDQPGRLTVVYEGCRVTLEGDAVRVRNVAETSSVRQY